MDHGAFIKGNLYPPLAFAPINRTVTLDGVFVIGIILKNRLAPKSIYVTFFYDEDYKCMFKPIKTDSMDLMDIKDIATKTDAERLEKRIDDFAENKVSKIIYKELENRVQKIEAKI